MAGGLGQQQTPEQRMIRGEGHKTNRRSDNELGLKEEMPCMCTSEN
jgi:hypothetical protein